ncbi:unnamed protein product [Rotaria sp. Silwood2]|nr:unnamed protein product [Rotaria sp. Silwood2]
MQQENDSENRLLKHNEKHRSNLTMSTTLRPSSESGIRFFSNFMHRTVTNRQRAEIQLESILNDPEVPSPIFAHRTSDQVTTDEFAIEAVSKLLSTQPFIIERLVKIIYPLKNDENSRTLNKFEVQKLTRVLNGAVDVRTLLFFMILDENDKNYITNRGLSQFYENYLENLKTFDNDRLQEVIQVLLQKFHLDQKLQIDYEEFFSIVSKDSTLLETLSQFTVHPTWFIERSSSSLKQRTRLEKFFSNLCWQKTIYEQGQKKLTVDYVKDNLSHIIFLILYLLVNLVLLLYVVIYQSNVTKSHVIVVLARIGGMLLNFNCSLVIVLMLKRTILLIRTNIILRKLIPVDDHISFHKFVGRVIVDLVILHVIAHMVNFGRMKEYSWRIYMFTTIPNIGWFSGFAPLSGVILCVILAIIVFCSMEWIRRSGHFEAFQFYLIIYINKLNKWIIGPLSLLLLEKFYSLLTRYSSRSGRTHLHSVTIEQSNVISLCIHRPKYFTFKPGDYVTINLPRVALYEFHPFTISSAPEDTNYLTVQIQAVGNWTKRIYQHFKDMSEADAQENHVKVYRADFYPEQGIAKLEKNIQKDNLGRVESNFEDDENETTPSNLSTKSIKREYIVINGPYSSSARYVFDCKHVVLIGGGIGITPHASILSSLMAQFRASRIVCKHCQGINYHTKGLEGNCSLKKVDFIWVNRDQNNFEWFLNLLRQFEQEQEYYLASNSDEKRFLDIHLYFTEIKHDDNIGYVPLDLVTKVWAEIAGQDIFTDLKSKTHIGRPKWDELFNSLISGENSSTANDVNVFFCGPSTMGKVVREHCETYRFRYYKEKF